MQSLPHRAQEIRLMANNESTAPLNHAEPHGMRESRMPALDGLRGWAVLAVMFYHFALPFAQQSDGRASWAILRVLLTGSYGVDMFFVLSGFLITGILLDSRNREGYFKTFYLRRLVRIFPLYYGVLAVCFGALFWMPVFNQYVSKQAWLWLYGANFTHLAGFDFTQGFAHFWSLAVEEHFYLVWPVIVLWCNRQQLMLVSMTMLLASAVTRCAIISGGWLDSETAAMITPLRLDGLAIGALIAAISRGPAGLLPFRKLAVGLVLAGTFASLVSKGLYGSNDGSIWGLSGIGHLTVSIAVSGILILSITGAGFWQTLLNWNLLRFFGKYSYGLYVFHFLLQPWLDGAFWFVPSLPALSLVLHIACATFITLGVSLWSWHLYEKQFLKLKKHFNYGPEKPADPQSLTIDSLALPNMLASRD